MTTNTYMDFHWLPTVSQIYM